MKRRGTAGSPGSTATVTVLLCVLVAMFEGVDLQAAGVAAPRLAPIFQMTPRQLGWFFSASTLGLIVGAAAGGRLSDFLGRKIVLVAATAVFGLLSVATAMMTTLEGLLVCRFLTGIGLGGALPNLIALVTECTRGDRGAGSVGLLYAGLPSGGALASLVTVFSGPEDWRLVFLVGGFAPLLLVPLLVVLLPDSRPAPVGAAGRAGPHGRGIVEALFGSGRGLRTLVLWGGFFCALLTMYLLLNWLPSLLVGRGLSRPDAAMVQVAFNLAGALGSIATGLAMDRLPRRAVIPLVFAAAAAALVLIAAIPAEPGVSILAGALVGGTITGAQAVLYALAPTLYPAPVRGTGVGAGVAVGRLGSAAGPLLGAALVGSGQPPSQVLLVLLPIVALAGLAAFVLTAAESRQTA
jgi:AAHS family 3-hydroxyphenylpropionic acid transporter